MTVRFDEALPNLIGWLSSRLSTLVSEGSELLIVRDLRGQLRAITRAGSILQGSAWERGDDEELDKLLGEFKAAGPFLIELQDSSSFDGLFHASNTYALSPNHPQWRMLDQLVTGREWLYPAASKKPTTPRMVFHGIKGGVGRSTALCMAAWHLARQGKRVLVLDLDLESPGLGSMLLPVRKDLSEDGDTGIAGWPTHGMVDWFVEDAVGQGDDTLLRNMTQPSPLTDTGRGEILVVPAAGGLFKQDYVSKLSRVYSDMPNTQGAVEVFGDRLVRAVEALEDLHSPDVVLVDSRAGIHHISASVLTRLGATCYLFASDSEQTWAGYGSLFAHWAHKPETIRALRTALRVVSALTPQLQNKDDYRARYAEHAYNTFARLYDDQEPDSSLSDELFSFGVFDAEAPHWPLLISRDDVYMSFSPLSLSIQIESDKAQLVFEELFAQIDADLENEVEQ